MKLKRDVKKIDSNTSFLELFSIITEIKRKLPEK